MLNLFMCVCLSIIYILFLLLLEISHGDEYANNGRRIRYRHGIFSTTVTSIEGEYSVIGIETRGYFLDPRDPVGQSIGSIFIYMFSGLTLEHHFSVLKVRTTFGEIQYFGIALYSDAGIQLYGPYNLHSIDRQFGGNSEVRMVWPLYGNVHPGTKLKDILIWALKYENKNPKYDLVFNNCQQLTRALWYEFGHVMSFLTHTPF